ncbi:MAG: cyclic nucleotide-binding domain-containing protein [Phycisphaerae bacterium]|nr:cyclic nucleotide-binding domain-containing protein [Phycisphaerae bacterium]
MTEANLETILRKVQCFSALDDDALELLRESMQPREVPAGTYICHEGDEGDRLFVIEHGEVAVLKRGDRAEPVEVATLSGGQIAGEMGLFGPRRRTASLRTGRDCRLWELDYDVFQNLLNTHSAFARALLACMNRHLRRETSVVARLLSQDSETGLKVAVFDTKPYTKAAFERHNPHHYALTFYEPRLTSETVALAAGFKVVCVFVNDQLDATVVEELAALGVELIALRCAGYNNVDLAAAERCGVEVVRVPAYSPHAVAEHAVALMMALNRKSHRASNRVREGNFSLDGLVGFDLHGKTVGIVGAGKIARCTMRILRGFGCEVLVHNRTRYEDLERELGVRFTDLDTLLRTSRVLSLHVPLTPETHHMIDADAIARMPDGVMIINTSRGALIDTTALIDELKSGKVGSAGLDVYEEERGYFFEDHSDRVVADDVLARLTTFNNVMLTSHQGFLTREALDNIAATTIANIRAHETDTLEAVAGNRVSHAPVEA